jgi:hypothetical protein
MAFVEYGLVGVIPDGTFDFFKCSEIVAREVTYYGLRALTTVGTVLDQERLALHLAPPGGACRALPVEDPAQAPSAGGEVALRDLDKW